MASWTSKCIKCKVGRGQGVCCANYECGEAQDGRAEARKRPQGISDSLLPYTEDEQESRMPHDAGPERGGGGPVVLLRVLLLHAAVCCRSRRTLLFKEHRSLTAAGHTPPPSLSGRAPSGCIAACWTAGRTGEAENPHPQPTHKLPCKSVHTNNITPIPPLQHDTWSLYPHST